MAIEPGIAATQPAGAPAASARVAAGSGRFGSGDPLEGLLGSAFVNLADQWRLGSEFNAKQHPFQQWLRAAAPPIQITPRVALAAASFPALATVEAEAEAPTKLTASDLQTAVGTYEYNMRVTSASARDQGSVINRFY